MEKNNLKSILLTIKSNIKKFVDGDITLKGAKDEFEKLKGEYHIIHNEICSNNQNNFLKGLLYHHNINNFSKITVLHNYSNSGIKRLCFYGDNNLLSVLDDYLLKTSVSKIKNNEIKKVLLEDKNNLPFYLYYETFNYDDDTKIISSTISSSHFFDISQFNHLNKLIHKIYLKNRQLDTNAAIDYFGFLSKKIIEYVNNNSPTLVYLFNFHSIKEIFNNAAISKFTEISKNIQKTLKKYFKKEVKIFVLSLTQYLVLFPIDTIDEKDFKTKNLKINFLYNDLLIPFEAVKIDTENFQSIYKLWDEIFLINNYINNGDIRL